MARSVHRSSAGGYIPVVTAIVLTLLVTLFNAFSFAALAAHPVVGKAFSAAIADDSPVVSLYVLGGGWLRAVPGLERIGDEWAAQAAEPLAARMTAYPSAAAAVFFGEPQSDAHSWMLRARTALPFLLLATLVLWWRRPRPVHMRERLRA